MEKITVLCIAATIFLGLIRLMLLPMKRIGKLLVNSLCGILCLWLINLTAGLTGFAIPVNPITAIIAGTLGLPGILLLGLLQIIL